MTRAGDGDGQHGCAFDLGRPMQRLQNRAPGRGTIVRLLCTWTCASLGDATRLAPRDKSPLLGGVHYLVAPLQLVSLNSAGDVSGKVASRRSLVYGSLVWLDGKVKNVRPGARQDRASGFAVGPCVSWLAAFVPWSQSGAKETDRPDRTEVRAHTHTHTPSCWLPSSTAPQPAELKLRSHMHTTSLLASRAGPDSRSVAACSNVCHGKTGTAM